MARTPSPAMVVALLALFISLGGVSYGVATGSINSRELENNTVQSRDLRDGGVQGRDIRNGTLRSVDVGANALGSGDIGAGAIGSGEITDRSIFGRDVASNSLGDREIDEPELDVGRLDGLDGSRYIRNVASVRAGTANDAATVKATPRARCPRGRRVIGGGAQVVAAAAVPVAISTSVPSGNGWVAAAYATGTAGNWQLVAVAICG